MLRAVAVACCAGLLACSSPDVAATRQVGTPVRPAGSTWALALRKADLRTDRRLTATVLGGPGVERLRLVVCHPSDLDDFGELPGDTGWAVLATWAGAERVVALGLDVGGQDLEFHWDAVPPGVVAPVLAVGAALGVRAFPDEASALAWLDAPLRAPGE